MASNPTQNTPKFYGFTPFGLAQRAKEYYDRQADKAEQAAVKTSLQGKTLRATYYRTKAFGAGVASTQFRFVSEAPEAASTGLRVLTLGATPKVKTPTKNIPASRVESVETQLRRPSGAGKAVGEAVLFAGFQNPTKIVRGSVRVGQALKSIRVRAAPLGKVGELRTVTVQRPKPPQVSYDLDVFFKPASSSVQPQRSRIKPSKSLFKTNLKPDLKPSFNRKPVISQKSETQLGSMFLASEASKQSLGLSQRTEQAAGEAFKQASDFKSDTSNILKRKSFLGNDPIPIKPRSTPAPKPPSLSLGGSGAFKTKRKKKKKKRKAQYTPDLTGIVTGKKRTKTKGLFTGIETRGI